MKYYYKTLEELNNASLKDKIDTFLFVNAKSAQISYEAHKDDKILTKRDYEEKNIKIGSLVKGEAYNHETNKYYDVIGFMVESEIEFMGEKQIVYGFRSIYLNTNDVYAPIDFDEGYSLEPYGQIADGYGNYVCLEEELVTSDEVNMCINKYNIDINKYLKDVNLYLSNKDKWRKKNDRSFSGTTK